MGEDGRQSGGDTRWKAGVRTSRRGQPHGAFGVDPIHRQPPAQKQTHRTQLHGGRRRLDVVADHRHRPGIGVEPASMRSLDGSGDSAESALEDLAVLVDERVVGDVAPPKGPRVVGVDAAHGFRRIGRRVVIVGRGVMHDPRLDLVVIQRCSASHRLISTPLCPADDAGWFSGRGSGLRPERIGYRRWRIIKGRNGRRETQNNRCGRNEFQNTTTRNGPRQAAPAT